MKHLLLSLLLSLILPAVVQAQSANPAIWCPAGATWTYYYGDMSGQGIATMLYSGDVVIGGRSAQVISGSCSTYIPLPGGGSFPTGSFPLPPITTRVTGDRVEVYVSGQFYTLYDFGAQPGDSWVTPLVEPRAACPQYMVRVMVDSVGRQQVGGRWLRWLKVHTAAASSYQYAGAWPARIYELVGSLTYMQPQGYPCGGTDPGQMGSAIGFSAGGPPAVNYSFRRGQVALSAQARAEAAGFTVYPNPSAGAGGLRIALPAGTDPAAQLRLLDLAGRVVLRQPASSGQWLDVRGLAAGVYSLQLSTPGTASLVCRVVLE